MAKGGLITEVRAGGLGDRLGLRPGDRVISINGHPLADWVDYRFHVTGEDLDLVIVRGEEEISLQAVKEYDEDLEIIFSDDLFNGVKKCHNACLFCFLKQMPAGMRGSLYVPDDDFRLSFLHGNFITLTNMRENDFQRIFSQRLSPLYISVHATDPAVRRRLMLNRQADRIMDHLRRLVEGGIDIHCQLVLCPGINDGSVLERSIADLTSLGEGVLSIAAVPVGLTRHREGLSALRPFSALEATQVLDTVARWQEKLLGERGTRVVFAADEFFVLADRPVPPAEEYEGYPQLENGIGLLRSLIDEYRDAAGKSRRSINQGRSVTVVTGHSAYSTIASLLGGEHGEDGVRVLRVQNRFFGPDVTVAGLLTGRDILAALKDEESRGGALGEEILLPGVVVGEGNGRFLDDLAPEDLAGELGVPVRVVPVDGAALYAALTKGGRV